MMSQFPSIVYSNMHPVCLPECLTSGQRSAREFLRGHVCSRLGDEGKFEWFHDQCMSLLRLDQHLAITSLPRDRQFRASPNTFLKDSDTRQRDPSYPSYGHEPQRNVFLPASKQRDMDIPTACPYKVF